LLPFFTATLELVLTQPEAGNDGKLILGLTVEFKADKASSQRGLQPAVQRAAGAGSLE
jgi:hypothetical protein